MCAISSKVFEISPQTIQDPVKSNYDMVHFFQLFTTEIPWLVHDGKDVIFRKFKFWFAIILCLSLLHYINGLTQGYGISNALTKVNVMKCWVLDLFCPDRGQNGPRSLRDNEWMGDRCFWPRCMNQMGLHRMIWSLAVPTHYHWTWAAPSPRRVRYGYRL